MSETKFTEAPVAVERCSAVGLEIRATEGDPKDIAEAMAAIDKYLAIFAQPIPEMRCLKCGTPQTGLLAAMLHNGFQWGLVNGEGACATCGWPGRGIHRIPDVGVLEMVLQYHPDYVQGKAAPAKARGET